ncbi:hypothetical protein [Streptomyces sp. NPDC056707]|uniref:hypothetical protein n=1 Tax=Streptomyces sp. NPDC056707 TaxID=3345919 RepID=UPI0036839FDB
MRARTTLAALALLGTLTLTAGGADTQSPPAHDARLKKAASISVSRHVAASAAGP